MKYILTYLLLVWVPSKTNPKQGYSKQMLVEVVSTNKDSITFHYNRLLTNKNASKVRLDSIKSK